MKFHDYSVRIPEGKELPNGMVEMEHGQKYSVLIQNHKGIRCDAILYIDGKKQIEYRLNPYDFFGIKRPSGSEQQFTFYKLDTAEGKKVGLASVKKEDLGLISVQFIPEIKPLRERGMDNMWAKGADLPTPYLDFNEGIQASASSGRESLKGYGSGQSAGGTSAGGTGLSGDSGQQFIKVPDINRDYDNSVRITLRLIAKETLEDPKPLPEYTAYATPVPPSVE